MKILNYIFKGFRKALSFPFKLVGNCFTALGLTLTLGINGILFPEDLSKMEALLEILNQFKENLDEGEGIVLKAENNVEGK